MPSRRVRSLLPLLLTALFTALPLTLPLAAQDPAAAPYHDDPAHPANRLFRAVFTVELVPAEVAAVLPGEHADDDAFFTAGWYFGKREGTEADRARYGGDRRQMPREGFDDAEAAAFATGLGELRDQVLADLRAAPRVAVYLQNDLLRLMQRLLTTGRNADLLPPLRAAVARLALPRAVLADPALATFRRDDVAPHLHGLPGDAFVELDRRSTRLFDAEYTQFWSRLWLATGDGKAESVHALLRAVAAADKGEGPEVPLGTTALLVQGIVAVDDQGAPCATEVVVDVRVQRFTNAEPLAAANPTTTRDGVDFAQWLLARRAVRDAGTDGLGLAAFTAIAMDQPEVFRDYGTLKLTTYRGQCSLCHRRTNTPETRLAGFSVLRQGARPQPVPGPGARLRLAEEQLGRLLSKLP